MYVYFKGLWVVEILILNNVDQIEFLGFFFDLFFWVDFVNYNYIFRDVFV